MNVKRAFISAIIGGCWGVLMGAGFLVVGAILIDGFSMGWAIFLSLCFGFLCGVGCGVVALRDINLKRAFIGAIIGTGWGVLMGLGLVVVGTILDGSYTGWAIFFGYFLGILSGVCSGIAAFVGTIIGFANPAAVGPNKSLDRFRIKPGAAKVD